MVERVILFCLFDVFYILIQTRKSLDGFVTPALLGLGSLFLRVRVT